VSQKFIYIFNDMALAEIKSPCIPLFQRGRSLREGVNPSLPKRGRGDLRAHLQNGITSKTSSNHMSRTVRDSTLGDLPIKSAPGDILREREKAWAAVAS
jgi:hypothetical protein